MVDMKLNLGCGGDYKEGHLNVDAFDSTVADKIMSSTDLKISDNTVDEILASQLIEHLGIVGSIYTFSECLRVLKPSRQLIIETPNLQITFEKYVKGDREARKNLLPWIHGVDIPGMMHRFCYPDDLLEETLKKIGFVNIKKEFLEFDKYQPILKITCEKPDNYQIFQVLTGFRKKLVQKKIVDLDDQLTSLEREDLIEFFTRKIDDLVKTNNLDIIKEIVAEGAVRSPIMTNMFLEEIMREKIISKSLLKNGLDALTFLTKIDFPNVLLHILKQTPEFVGEQEKLFSTIHDIGIKTVEKILQSEKKHDIISNLQKTSRKIKPQEKIAFFSPKLIMLKANRLFQLGVKEFVLRRYKEATCKFMESSDLYRDQILTYWNLGRLLYLQDKKDEAISYYKNAIKLVDIFDYKNKIDVKRSLEHEMNEHNTKIYSEPITTLNG